MTITKGYQYDGSLPYYIGLAADDKDALNAPIGALFLETDTMHEFVFSSTNDWLQKQSFTT